MLRILPIALTLGFLSFTAWTAGASSRSAYALNHGANMPAPKIKANSLAPLCRVCTTGRACGDSCTSKKLA